jgi:hypothetical protein
MFPTTTSTSLKYAKHHHQHHQQTTGLLHPIQQFIQDSKQNFPKRILLKICQLLLEYCNEEENSAMRNMKICEELHHFAIKRLGLNNGLSQLLDFLKIPKPPSNGVMFLDHFWHFSQHDYHSNQNSSSIATSSGEKTKRNSSSNFKNQLREEAKQILSIEIQNLQQQRYLYTEPLHFEPLSKDLVAHIFTYLDCYSLAQVLCTSYSWSRLYNIEDDGNEGGPVVENACLELIREYGIGKLLECIHEINPKQFFINTSNGTSIKFPPALIETNSELINNSTYRVFITLWVYYHCLNSSSGSFHHHKQANYNKPTMVVSLGQQFSSFIPTNPNLFVQGVSVGGAGGSRYSMYATGPDLQSPNTIWETDYCLSSGDYFLVIDNGFNPYHGRFSIEIDGKNVLLQKFINENGQELPPKVWVGNYDGRDYQVEALSMGFFDQFSRLQADTGIFVVQVHIDETNVHHRVRLTIPGHKHKSSLGYYICLQGLSFIPAKAWDTRPTNRKQIDTKHGKILSSTLEICEYMLPGVYRQNGKSGQAIQQRKHALHDHYLLLEDGTCVVQNDVVNCV